MENSHHDGTPAYKRIQAAILQDIENGGLRPGDAVDSERELARIYHVSLMTARHALAVLERDGVVRRKRGSGTFVAPPVIHFNKLMSFTEQMAGRSLAACSKVLSFSVVEREQEIAARLALAPSTPLIKLERLRMGASEPFAVETCYLSGEEFVDLNRNSVVNGSLFAALERNYGVTISYADEEVDATAADSISAQLLRIPRGQPLLRIRQIIYSTKGNAVVYVLGLYRSDRHNLLIRRFR